MNHLTYFEDRASRSRGTYAGESSPGLCDRLSRTRDFSQRQLPTDHDYAVPTREYQTDQSSFNSAPAVAGPVLDRPKPQRQKNPTDVQGLTRSLHISPGPSPLDSNSGFSLLSPHLRIVVKPPRSHQYLFSPIPTTTYAKKINKNKCHLSYVQSSILEVVNKKTKKAWLRARLFCFLPLCLYS